MKKNFKFMLLGLLAVFGVSLAWSDPDPAPETFEDGNYVFAITKAPGTTVNGKVKLIGLTDAAKALKNTDGQEPYISNGVLEFPGTATDENGKTYDVTEMASEAFAHVAYYATSVTIPATLTEIPEAAFNTLTNLASIEFEEGSQVKKIGAQAFASTRITEFDFTKCVDLEGLNDEVFVERCTDAQRQDNNGFNPNTNSYITKVTVPTSANFKHINGAFRNLTELTEIGGLENSWIQEIVESAFANTKIGTTKALVLPEKDLLYIDKNALKGSQVTDLTIKVGSLLYIGGCTVTYTQNETTGEYTYTYTVDGASTNLYGFAKPTTTTPASKIAPLENLTLTGTLKGKICKNAFLGNINLDGLDLTGLQYGSKAQFETSAFEYCTGITELFINEVNNNETEGYTFEKDAFKDCPIETLTMKKVGTAKAVNETAFGTSLKNVTIGTVDAGAAAFAKGAFTYGIVSEATLDLAAGDNEYLNSKDAKTALIPAGAFDFSAIYDWSATTAPVYPVVTIGEIKSKGAAFEDGAIAGPVAKITFDGPIARNGLTVGGDDASTAPEGVKILKEGENKPSVFKTLIFNGAVETNGIGSRAFADFRELTSVTFNGLLSELAVAESAFSGSGKKVDNSDFIGSENAPFVKYTVTGIENWAVNPFASTAFGTEDDNELAKRIIVWEIADETLNTEITYAIHKAVADIDPTDDIEYEGREYSAKFNVYKWIDKLYVAPETPEVVVEVPNFLFFQDQLNDNNVAWGRYDLGSFTAEKGKAYKANATQEEIADNPALKGYQATNMVIPRIQETTGAKVKLTLYGLYYDEDAFSEVSTTYLVPLRVVNGTYQIPSDNKHLIIGKAEVQSGSFSDKDVKIYYNNVPNSTADGAWTSKWSADPEDADALSEEYNAENTAIWTQLGTERRVYSKATADDAKTHQELYDAVVRYSEGSTAGEATNVTTKDLWVMTDPAKYKGFRVDKNPVTKDNYTFLGEGWYYALLNNYKKQTSTARVIWLDEAQATAIFGVKNAAAQGVKVNDGAIYNLQGVRVSNPTKAGIYIQNGKKFIVK